MRFAAIAKLLPYLGLVLSVGFLGFVAGGYVMFANAFPARHLTDAYRGGQALFDKTTQYDDPYPATLWQPSRSLERGVTVHDAGRAFAGFTLYTSGHAQKALLISMTGAVVHEWSLPFSEVWDESAAVKEPRPDELVYWRKAHLYPNGDLLVIYEGVGDTPWGYGLVKMNRDSEIIWKYLEPVHHDIDVGPDGRIYALTHEIRSTVIDPWKHLEPPRIDDFIVVLSPEGEELARVSLVDQFVHSSFAPMVNTVAWYSKGDYFHTNTIKLLDPAYASRLTGSTSPQQLLVSMRELNALAVFDLEQEAVTWAVRGPWLGQHDPDPLPDGGMLLFDNFGHYGPGGRSRIIEFDPLTLGITWSYTGDDVRPFYSNVRGSQQRLPNGNTLITESEGGRLFEVARDGALVWEYRNPVRGGDDDEFTSIVCWGQRIDPAMLDADFRAALGT